MNPDSESYETLIAIICANRNHHNPEYQRAMDRLLRRVQRLPKLLKSSHIDYLEALDQTLEWLSHHICEFEPRLDEPIEVSLTRWINGTLKWRIKDLPTLHHLGKNSLDQAVNDQNDDFTTYLDQAVGTLWDIPTLSGLDAYVEQLHNQDIQLIFQRFQQYVLEDPDHQLSQCHPRKYPQCHCQLLCQRLILQQPPQRLAEISREFSINYQTLNSHWEKKCKPLLQQVLIDLGYIPEGYQLVGLSQ